jgi:hypothetical protein
MPAAGRLAGATDNAVSEDAGRAERRHRGGAQLARILCTMNNRHDPVCGDRLLMDQLTGKGVGVPFPEV